MLMKLYVMHVELSVAWNVKKKILLGGIDSCVIEKPAISDVWYTFSKAG